MDAPTIPVASPESGSADHASRVRTVVVWAPDHVRRAEMVELVGSAGWLPLVAESEANAVKMLTDAPPDLFVVAVDDGDADDLTVIDRVRLGPDGERVPIVCVLARRHRGLTLDAFGRRVDDVVVAGSDPDELIARFRTRIERPPVPRAYLVVDPVTGALTSEAFEQQLQKEEERVRRGGDPGALAFVSFDELPEITTRHGSRARDELLAQIVRLIKDDGRKLDFVGWRRNVIAILLPDTPAKGAQARFDRLVKKIYDREFALMGEPVKLTPVIGYTATVERSSVEQYEDRAWDALVHQAEQLDLHPTRWVAAMSGPTTSSNRLTRIFDRYRTPIQVIGQQLAAIILPFLTYWMLDSLGADITGFAYLALVVALGVTATLIWGESHTAVAPTEPPAAPEGPPPRASAIIAAYLPNEAATVVETVEAFLRQDYPDLEVILAYNTPTRLDVEDDLRSIAARDARFVPFRVEGSVSKAQNVNAALAKVTGEFVGLFDADHHPAPGSFHRAWCWIADGAGVVQGHCVIRNGEDNLVTKLVATEFEAIYAVSHPGRARMHGFGVFGGSNGYWRTSLLHRTRMRGSMLTEDIDSSMRVVQSGEVIISDPDLVSTELAPDTVGALWNQRLRWAQGWSQVSLRHLIRMTRTMPRLRQRLGVAYLLGWREIYPWVSLQMFPLLGYWWFKGEPAIEWFVPIFVFTSLLTFSAGPAQTYYAWRLAHPSIKRNKRWFVGFGFASLFFYTEVKNVVARTAHLKELMGERKWKVTPRTGSIALDAEAAGTVAPVEPVDTRTAEIVEADTDRAASSSVDEAPDGQPARRHDRRRGLDADPKPVRALPSTRDQSTADPQPEIVSERTDQSETTSPPVAGAAEPARATAAGKPTAERPSASSTPRRRRRRTAPPRRRRHRIVERAVDEPRVPSLPQLYDHELEPTVPTVYDHALEDLDERRRAEATQQRPQMHGQPSAPGPAAGQPAATGTVGPLTASRRPYLPAFLDRSQHPASGTHDTDGGPEDADPDVDPDHDAAVADLADVASDLIGDDSSEPAFS